MNNAKKLFCLSLSLWLVLSLFALPCSASDVQTAGGEIRILSYNVDGLPIPQSLSSSGRNARESTEKMIEYINEYSPDIFAAQEDFNYHSIFKASVDAPYRTYTSGPVPFGDGLNFFSKFPLYNVSRVTWNDAYGVLTDGSDELTPKGLLYAVFEIAEGVNLDVYTIHTDGYEDEGSIAARTSQYNQLVSLINEQSKDRPVVIVGDFNSRLCREYQKMRKIFIEQEGFSDAWTEVCFGGEYPVWESEEQFNRHTKVHDWWGKFDSIDRVMYRSGAGITLEAVSHEYQFFTDDGGVSLSDHAATKVTLKYTAENIVSDTRELKDERYNLFARLFGGAKSFFKSLRLILLQLPALIKGEIIIDWK